MDYECFVWEEHLFKESIGLAFTLSIYASICMQETFYTKSTVENAWNCVEVWSISTEWYALTRKENWCSSG